MPGMLEKRIAVIRNTLRKGPATAADVAAKVGKDPAFANLKAASLDRTVRYLLDDMQRRGEIFSEHVYRRTVRRAESAAGTYWSRSLRCLGTAPAAARLST